MNYLNDLKHHYRPKKGWVNDPNGLCWFGGYYHVFYQHCPNCETPDEPMCWGHARTKDFITWEELPIALAPDMPYDKGGCWSGTAIEKDGVLYLYYASVVKDGDRAIQSVSVAYSEDGINFNKYAKNPIIATYPQDGSPDFRDPALACIDGRYYCVMASSNAEHTKGRLLLYTSENMFDWEYVGIMAEWDGVKCAECPSFMPAGNQFLLSASLMHNDGSLSFSIMYGDFKDNKFIPKITGQVDKGPDQYAGQLFSDRKGRNLLITWIPGWSYAGFAERNIGCMSVPREFFIKDGKVMAYPAEEVRHLLKDSDPAVKIIQNGFIIPRNGRTPVTYKGEIRDLKILRDECFLEVFVNGGEEIYSVLL